MNIPPLGATGPSRRIFLACASISLVFLWSQFLSSGRHAGIPGSLHGPRRPFFVAALAFATLALLLPRRGDRFLRPLDSLLPNVALAGGIALLAAGCVVWLPPGQWTALPYLDNWTTRYLSTVDGIALLKQGAAVGWNWDFLGGYHTASDITQTLSLVALLPVLVLGDPRGYHLVHYLLFLGIPIAVYADLRLDGGERLARLGAGLAAIGAAGLSYILMRSGDTNSLSGLASAVVALTSAHAAAAGRRWGGPLLVVSMASAAWSHTGFFLYASGLLVLDAAMARDLRRAGRAAAAALIAVVAALPLTWELWRYPDYFIANNVVLAREASIDWGSAARKVAYNLELLWLPGRWFNDFGGLTHAVIPLLLYTAWRATGRVRFYAAAAIAALAATRLQTADTAYLFVRPMHLVAVFTPVALAGFAAQTLGDGWRRWALVLLVPAYLQIFWTPVPHVFASGVEPELVTHLSNLDGALVLVENTPHRDMNVDPGRDVEPAPVPVHVESILPRLTGRRLYAGMWDGWQWCPQRDELLAGGAFRGASISTTPPAAVHREFLRWGVRHAVVWSRAAVRFFDADPAFARTWASGPWVGYAFLDADPREVVTRSGGGRLLDRTPLGGRVALDGVGAGDRVVLRTHYFPAWTAAVDGAPLALVDDDGQLAFDAPRSGSYVVDLTYPRRTWLLALALAAVVAGMLALGRPRRGSIAARTRGPHPAGRARAIE